MKLSSYILTRNSERYLSEILERLSRVADEVVIVDSGSTDATLDIATRYPLVHVEQRDFDNFRAQRDYAASVCSHDAVFYVDSDELPDDELLASLRQVKEQYNELGTTAFSITRDWYILGKPVHAIYPIVSPDHDIRLFDRRYASFGSGSSLVHETLSGYSQRLPLAGRLMHRTFHSKEEMRHKVDHYTDLSAQDLLRKKGNISRLKALVDPPAAFIKWYLLKRSFLDGRVGLTCGIYAYRYTKLRYRKALRLQHQR